jgi:UDP-glucose 4-epimerase
MKYLITGGCGFIGSHIAEALLENGHEVVVYDNLSSGYEKNISGLNGSLELIKADIRDDKAFVNALDGVTGIFHEAALVSVFKSVDDPLENHDINSLGTLKVLLHARDLGVERVVLASSAAVYGNDPALPKKENMKPLPESPYGLSKLDLEHYARLFNRLYGVDTVCLRYFNVYGPRQDPSSMYSGVISRFADFISSCKNPVVFGDGEQTRDFVYVKDVVQANLLAMESAGATGKVYNVGTGSQTSLLDLLEAFRSVTGKDFQTDFQEQRAGDIRHSVSDISAISSDLGYKPQYSVREGLKLLLKSLE